MSSNENPVRTSIQVWKSTAKRLREHREIIKQNFFGIETIDEVVNRALDALDEKEGCLEDGSSSTCH